MKLRLLSWLRLLSPNTIEHALPLPILFHCIDQDYRPVLARSQAPALAEKNGWSDIPVVVKAMRQFWMPTRFTRSG